MLNKFENKAVKPQKNKRIKKVEEKEEQRKETLSKFFFPTLGKTIEARNEEEALAKIKKL